MQESSLPRIVAVLWARVLLIVVLAVPVLALGAWYAVSREPVYRSEAVLSFTPENVDTAPGDAFLRLVRRYQLVATSPDMLGSAEEVAGVPAGALRGAVTAESPGNTLQLGLSVQADSAVGAERAVAALAEVIVERADGDPLVEADVLIEATEAEDVTPLRRLLAVSAGVVLAPVPGIGVAFLLEGSQPRVRTRADLAALGVPVLFTIHRRRLRRRERQGSADPLLPGFPVLRAHLRPASGCPGGAGVVLTSPSLAESRLVASLARAVAGPRTPPAGDEPVEPVVELLPRPGLLTEDSAVAAVNEGGRVVLVVLSGTPRDVAEDCVRLLGRLGADLAGTVLVR